MRKWSRQDYQTMPWKNGGGSTTELAIFPEGASLENFFWRLSTAQVSTAGPFSHFARIDRSLAILSGDGLILHSDSELSSAFSVTLDPSSMPYRFAGETAIHAEPCGGAVLDLNLMTRRDVCQHFMQRLLAGEHHVVATDAQQVLLYCAQGNASLGSGDSLQAGDLILFEEEHEHAGIELHINAEESAVLYLMRISFLNQGEGNYAAMG
ncbi:MAG: HutD family protein [Undibacterium sp.]|uniref:HutD/Ves family protein n=1 Tax=Undibacterium sp. TaxID=1914977 RepID=UPI00271F8F79|nr:HutD family protein [Undibacterium sp.]MDO8652357.1 HutD family protein [Undibacterium sp.]